MKPRLIVVGPLPPPVHGVSLSTELVLANEELQRLLAVRHLDTSDHRTGLANLGRWDPVNMALALRSTARLVVLLRGEKGVLYLPLSQGGAGLLRDSLFILTAAGAGWTVAAHLRGSELGDFYVRQNPLARALIRLSLRRLSSVAVLGRSLTHVLDGLVPPERVVVVPNGTPDPGSRSRSSTLGPVLYLSNLRERKGVREAVETALLVLEQEPEARFQFVGDFENDRLRRDVKRLAGPHPGIHFLPAASGSAKNSLLHSASMLLFPPRLPEGQPRVVLEALAAGLPVVATDRGAIAETVVDGEAGFVLAEPDPECLAECVLRLLRDDELRERMSRAARARYLAHYTQRIADEALAEWLYGLVPSPSRPARA